MSELEVNEALDELRRDVKVLESAVKALDEDRCWWTVKTMLLVLLCRSFKHNIDPEPPLPSLFPAGHEFDGSKFSVS